MTSEAQVTRSIMGWLKRQPDIYVQKVVGTAYGRAGRPDIQGNVGPFVFYIEVKSSEGRLSERQKVEIETIRSTGAPVWVVRSLAEAQGAIEALRSIVREVTAALGEPTERW